MPAGFHPGGKKTVLYLLNLLNPQSQQPIMLIIEANNVSFNHQPSRYVLIATYIPPRDVSTLFGSRFTKETCERLISQVTLSNTDRVILSRVKDLATSNSSDYPKLKEYFQKVNSPYKQTAITLQVYKSVSSDYEKWEAVFSNKALLEAIMRRHDACVASLNRVVKYWDTQPIPHGPQSSNSESHPNSIPMSTHSIVPSPNNPTSKNTTANQKTSLQPSTRPDLLAQENSKLKETLAEHATRIDVLEGNLAKQFNTIRQCEIAIERLQKMYEQTQATLEKIVGTDSTDPMDMLSTISTARVRLPDSCDTFRADTDDSHLAPSSNHLDPNNNNNTINEHSRKRSSDTNQKQGEPKSRKKIKLFDIDLNSNPTDVTQHQSASSTP